MPAVVSCPLCGIDRWDGPGPCSTCGGPGTAERCDGSGQHGHPADARSLAVTCRSCHAQFESFEVDDGAPIVPTHTREQA